MRKGFVLQHLIVPDQWANSADERKIWTGEIGRKTKKKIRLVLPE